MKEKILIVEDQFAEANYLELMLTKAGYTVMGIARSFAEAQTIIGDERPDFVLLDIFLKGKQTGIDLAVELSKENIPFIYLSANSNEKVLNVAKDTHPYGFLVKPFREKDLLMMLEIARYRYAHSIESGLKKETALTDTLLKIVSGSDSQDKKMLAICKALQPYIPFDYITAGFNAITETPDQAVSFLRIGFDEYQKIGMPELLTITRMKMKDLVAMVNNNMSSLYELLSGTFSMKSCASLRLQLPGGRLFTFSVYSRLPDSYNMDILKLSTLLQSSISGFVESIFFNAPVIHPGNPSDIANQSSLATKGFEGIIGKSHLLLNVFDMISQVAPSDTSVLILGESGTGKERIADCIHNLSPRKNKPLVKVNCATLPANLIESELFGHEKGSFTGATDKRIGKFEKADKGTIFLDEIGEMPLDLQAKLLRVLQEKYIERIGARDTTPVDVRIIAATNRNLEKEVAERRFRLDLYYRLNVFPVELPALRERPEDIPPLTEHFVKYYSNKTGKQINGVSGKALRSMEEYHWPGNIRELENLVERAVLLTKGTMIESVAIPVNQQAEKLSGKENARLKTIHENERDHIITVLKKCKGKIWGAGGAAEMLDLPSSTLRSRMKKLGINKEDIEPIN